MFTYYKIFMDIYLIGIRYVLDVHEKCCILVAFFFAVSKILLIFAPETKT